MFTELMLMAAGDTASWQQHAEASAGVAVPPVMVPCKTVPFFSSICTVSFDSFIKNLQQQRRVESRDPEPPLSLRSQWIC